MGGEPMVINLAAHGHADRRVLLGIAGLVTICVVALALSRSGVLRHRPDTIELIARSQSDGATAYSVLSVAKLKGLSREDVLAALSRADVTGKPKASNASADALEREAAEFIFLRFVAQDFDQYVQWRLSRGCRFLALDEMERVWFVHKEYQEVCGEPPPSVVTAETLMRGYWRTASTLHAGANRAMAMCDDPRGAMVCFDFIRTRHDDRIRLQGTLGPALWYGPVSSTMRTWFAPPTPTQDLFAAQGGLDVAEVGVVMEFEDGSRRPVVLAFFFDPARTQWVLRYVNQNNFDPRRLSCLEY
jgi:hypothetical protein